MRIITGVLVAVAIFYCVRTYTTSYIANYTKNGQQRTRNPYWNTPHISSWDICDRNGHQNRQVVIPLHHQSVRHATKPVQEIQK
jgi:hypothetical protein